MDKVLGRLSTNNVNTMVYICGCDKQQTQVYLTGVFLRRFPQLFPPLKPEVVAQRTVDAVRTNTAFVYLPWTMHALVILKRYSLILSMFFFLNQIISANMSWKPSFITFNRFIFTVCYRKVPLKKSTSSQVATPA